MDYQEFDRAFDILQLALSCTDIISSANKLLEFATIAQSSKNRAKLAKVTYRDITSIAIVLADIFGEEDSYRLFTGNHAVRLFLFLHIPQDLTPVKLFKCIIAFCEKTKSEFEKPTGKFIQESFIKEAVAYLNNTYSFFNKVYKNEIPVFILLNNSHQDYNSVCSVRESNAGLMRYFIILFNMRHDAGEEAVPEYVFLHELGHALQVSITGSISKVPASFRKYIAQVNPSSESLSEPELCEVFADTFAMAVMYHDQFSKYDPFPMISQDAKEICGMYIEKLMQTIREE